MGESPQQRSVVPLVAASVVATAILGSIFYLRSKPSQPVKFQEVHVDVGRLDEEPENLIWKDLRSGDPNLRASAMDRLHTYVKTQPDMVLSDFRDWVRVMSEGEMYEEVLAFTEKAMTLTPWDASFVSDQQQARVKALLALNRNEQALSEAKSAFNVAHQKTVDRTIDQIIEALEKVHGDKASELVERFKQEVQSNNPTLDETAVLAEIPVEQGKYASAIQKLATEPTYEHLLGEGNLLLLENKPQAAIDAFVKAASSEKDLKGKKLQTALDGVVRAKRAVGGSINPSNAMIIAFKVGATESPVLSCLASLNLQVEQLYDAGRAISPAVLPKELPSLPSNSFLIGLDLKGRMDAPIHVVEAAVPTDQDLLTWLKKLNPAQPASDTEQHELTAILTKSPLELGTLFEFAKVFYLSTEDDRATTLIYVVTSKRAHASLAALGQLPEAIAIVRMIYQYQDDFVPPLWHRMNERRDKDAREALSTFYADFLRSCPEDDAEVGKRRPYMTYCMAGVYLQMGVGKFADALEAIETVDTRDMTPGWRRVVGWRHGNILFGLHRYEEAIPYLREVADRPGFIQRVDAQRRLVLSLAYLRRDAEARAALNDFVNDFRPSPEDAQATTTKVNKFLEPSGPKMPIVPPPPKAPSTLPQENRK